MTKHYNDNDKLKSSDNRKIPINNTNIVYKNDNKNRLQVHKAKNIYQTTINNIAFNTGIYMLNIFNN